MLQTQTQHVFSHQHQYPQAEPSWLHQQQQQQQQQQQHHQAQHHQQQQQHSSLAAQQHAQAQAAAAAAAAAQQQHYSRIAMAGGNGSAGGNQAQGSGNNAVNADGSSLSAGAGIDGNISEESRKVFIWVAELLDPNRRETALMELSKKREQVPELALVIWHSFGMLFSLFLKSQLTCRRCHDCVTTRDHFRLPFIEPFAADCRCLEPSL